MSLPQYLALVLEIIAVIVIFTGGAAAIVVFVQIIRQSGWKLAEPSVIQDRWRTVRPWLLVGVGGGLLFPIAHYVLRSIDQAPPAAPNEVIISQPAEQKSRPRGRPTD